MKIPSSYLYDLVHQLSKAEKRYIKVQALSKESDYLLLLDALLTQEVFDEGELIRQNSEANFVKHLAVNKRYLYDLILKVLANFGEKSLEDQVLSKLNEAKVLYKKAMYDASMKELSKARRLALSYELFDVLLLVISLEKKIVAEAQLRRDDELYFEDLYKVELDCLAQIKNTASYWHLAQKVVRFQLKFQRAQSEEQKNYLQDLMQFYSNPDLSAPSNVASQLSYFQSWATCQFMLGNLEEAFNLNTSFLTYLDSKPEFIKIYAERYLATLNNMLIDSFGMGKFQELEKGIQRLGNLPSRDEFKSIKNLGSRVFRQQYLLLLNYHLSQGHFDQASSLIPEIREGLEKYGKEIEKHHRFTFYYLLAYISFIQKNHEIALGWNDIILNESKEDVVKEIFYFARVLNLIIHFELKNYELVDSLLLSTPKYLKARRKLFQTELALFRYLRRLLNAKDKQERQKHQAAFQTELASLSQIPEEKRMFSYLNLELWC